MEGELHPSGLHQKIGLMAHAPNPLPALKPRRQITFREHFNLHMNRELLAIEEINNHNVKDVTESDLWE